jgi:hypothetical protein
MEYLKRAGMCRDRGKCKSPQAKQTDDLPQELRRLAPPETAAAMASGGDPVETLPAQFRGAEKPSPPPPSASGISMPTGAYDCEPSEEMCREALRHFYSGLVLNEEDNLTLFERRPSSRR